MVQSAVTYLDTERDGRVGFQECHMHVDIYIQIYICMHVCMYVYICI